jgi:hypothetical protein
VTEAARAEKANHLCDLVENTGRGPAPPRLTEPAGNDVFGDSRRDITSATTLAATPTGPVLGRPATNAAHSRTATRAGTYAITATSVGKRRRPPSPSSRGSLSAPASPGPSARGGTARVWVLAPNRSMATTRSTAGRAPAICAVPSIASLLFRPRVVVEGQNANLRAVITNCTGRSFSGSLETFGRLVWVAVDPILTPVGVPSGSTVPSRMVYRAPACTGQGFITGRLVNHSGRVISLKVATVTIVAPPLVLPAPIPLPWRSATQGRAGSCRHYRRGLLLGTISIAGDHLSIRVHCSLAMIPQGWPDRSSSGATQSRGHRWPPRTGPILTGPSLPHLGRRPYPR